MKTLLSTSLFVFFCITANAQNSFREIGIRTGGFNSFGFIFKDEDANGKINRIRVGVFDISRYQTGTQGSTKFGFGIAGGREYRTKLDSKLDFISGIEPLFNFEIENVSNSSSASRNTFYNIEAGIGFIVGFQYNISESLYINAETIPAISGRYETSNSEAFAVKGVFNLSIVAITFAYRFIPIKN
jgi:hypothetical protein